MRACPADAGGSLIRHACVVNTSPITSAILGARLRTDAMRRRIDLLRRHFALESSRATYLSLAALEQRRRSPSGNAGPLTRYELRCFSQNGEDGVLAEILSRIGSDRAFFVEFGIQDGREGNCVLLADVEAWSGLFIEADAACFERLASKYAGSQAIKTMKAWVTPDNIEELLAAASVPADFDVLSIDIDGQDYWVWAAIESWRPRVVVVEYNSSFPPSDRRVAPRSQATWDGTGAFGSSLSAFEDLAQQKGYVLVHTELTALNAFFVRGDLTAGRFPKSDQVPRRSQPNYALSGAGWLLDSRSQSDRGPEGS